MSLRDDLLPMLEQIRAIPEDLGMRTIRVWVRSQSRTAAFGLAGTTTDTDTEITPRPKCVRNADKEGFYGASMAPRADGKGIRRVYEIGPITPDHATGGKKVSELFGVGATDAARPLVMMADQDNAGDLGVTRVAFKILSVIVKNFRLMVTVIEADDID